MHDDPIITLNMFIDDPKSIRCDERVKAGKATHQRRVDRRQGEEHGAGEEDRRVPRRATVAAINKAIANKGKATMAQP